MLSANGACMYHTHRQRWLKRLLVKFSFSFLEVEERISEVRVVFAGLQLVAE
jgi:hypothetical protein